MKSPSRPTKTRGRRANDAKKPSKTDWKRVDAMKDSEIDFSDIPEVGPDFFAKAILWRGTEKQTANRILGDQKVKPK